jgi:hypothetical protein
LPKYDAAPALTSESPTLKHVKILNNRRFNIFLAHIYNYSNGHLKLN